MFRQQRLLVVLAAVCFSATARAEPVRVCVHDQINLPEPAEASMRAELKLLCPRLKMVAQSSLCKAEAEGQVLIFVKDTDDGVAADALGRTPILDARTMPGLGGIQGSSCALSGANDLEPLGPARERVGAHELLHYLLQQSGHYVTGRLQQRLGATARRSQGRSGYVSLVASR